MTETQPLGIHVVPSASTAYGPAATSYTMLAWRTPQFFAFYAKLRCGAGVELYCDPRDSTRGQRERESHVCVCVCWEASRRWVRNRRTGKIETRFAWRRYAEWLVSDRIPLFVQQFMIDILRFIMGILIRNLL